MSSSPPDALPKLRERRRAWNTTMGSPGHLPGQVHAADGPDVPWPRATVLVVEDELDIRTAVVELLEICGYRVCAAVDGVDAADQLRTGLTPDAVLLDLMMPRMDGWALLDLVRSDRAFDSVRVIVATAMYSPTLPAGADALLEKPFDLDRLRSALALATAP